MASFALEIIGRPVHDVAGEVLGNVVDLRVAEGTGALSHIIVAPLENINTEQLPWPSTNRLVEVPIDVVQQIASVVRLHQ